METDVLREAWDEVCRSGAQMAAELSLERAWAPCGGHRVFTPTNDPCAGVSFGHVSGIFTCVTW